MAQPHILLVTFPGQGHINPSLQFAKSLVRAGAQVTFATSISAYRRMAKTPTTHGLSFAPYSDGYDDGFPPDVDVNHYMAELKRRGSETLTHLIESITKEGCSFSCLAYTVLIPWVAEVARELHIPSVLLWNQPASVFDIYYYFNGYRDAIEINLKEKDRFLSIDIPGLPPLTSNDLPSFLDPSSEHTFALPAMQKQLEILNEETNPRILVNTFDALEHEALRAIGKIDMVAVGPLIPSAFLGGKDSTDNSFGGDLFHHSKDYVEWLDSKEKASVIYVSFGSLTVLPKRQMEEIARGLLDTDCPFLWVVRGTGNGEEEKLSCMEELKQHGIIVPWCSQLEVLSHPSVGCFMTHCGWNSTLESLVSGVPVVAFPQWTDQSTNAKLIQDLWKTGLRVTVNGEGIAEGGEIRKCLELVMKGGDRGEEMRRNAIKWKDLAREAAKEDGASHKHLRNFLEEIGSSA